MKSIIFILLLAVAAAQINKEFVTIQNVVVEVKIPDNSCLLYVTERFSLYFEEVGSTFLTRKFSEAFLPQGSAVTFISTPEVIAPDTVSISKSISKGVDGPELRLNMYRFPMKELFYLEVNYLIDGWLFQNEYNQTELFFGANYYMNRIPHDVTGHLTVRLPHKAESVSQVHQSGIPLSEGMEHRYENGNTILKQYSIPDGYDFGLDVTIMKQIKECSHRVINTQETSSRIAEKPKRTTSNDIKLNDMQILFFSMIGVIALLAVISIATSCIYCHVRARIANRVSKEFVELDQIVLDQVKQEQTTSNSSA
ncbi:rlmG [Acrasis kona]|uniref:RlmG n=1 Tax=Acrasis kona TaxID=1008807 RepID=A0AAW2ZPF2_9EUKA